jgi:hypothetical protein
MASLEKNLLTSTRDLNGRANRMLDQGETVPNLIQITDGVASFTKPELASETDDEDE